MPVFSQVGDHLDGMKISYDNATKPLYIQLAGRPAVGSNEVDDGVVLDFDAKGAGGEWTCTTSACGRISTTCR